MILDWRNIMYNQQLEMFILVAELGSFNKAAQQNYISSTAVIKQINLLEENLGIVLFERTHRGILLTDAGKSLYNDAKYIIQYCKDAKIRAQNASKNKLETIRVGSSPITPTQFLIDLWPQIKNQCPNFKLQLIPFENTPESAREILLNLGQNIDVVPGIFDDALLKLRQCNGLELMRLPICIAVSINHRLASKDKVNISDLYGEDFLIMKRGWSTYTDQLRDDLWKNHPQINLIDFEFYDTEIFNQCENNNSVLMAVGNWSNIHPLMRIIPVEWEYKMPYGLLYSKNPSSKVKVLLNIIKKEL